MATNTSRMRVAALAIVASVWATGLAAQSAILVSAERRVHLHVRIQGPDGVVRQTEVVRGDLRRGLDAGGPGAAQLVDGLARREVEQVQRTGLVAGESEVAGDHHALRHRGVASEAELGGDDSLVDMSSP